MTRPKEKVLEKLREQMDFLRSSLRAFYGGQFAESLRIAATDAGDKIRIRCALPDVNSTRLFRCLYRSI